MKEILNHLFAHKKLTKSEAKDVIINISEGKYNDSQIAVFMGVYMMRSVSVEELSGFKQALLELCVKVDLGGIESIDMCGTGGDGKNTFNISTASSFVVAGAGYNVTKHGNYGVSSISGSSNVLEHIGYTFTTEVDKLKRQLEASNLCFIHAPLFHPAMKTVAPIRRAIGVKTFFNMLGPLVNPARPTHQSVGVFSLELARLYQYLFEQEDCEYTILHSLDGYDEISLTDKSIAIERSKEAILPPSYFGLDTHLPATDIYGGDTIEEAANILLSVLRNTATDSQQKVVLANAGMAIKTFEKNMSIEDCCSAARESIVSGKAYKVLTQSIDIN